MSKLTPIFLAATALIFAVSCGDDAAPHADVHVQMTAAPPATATAGTAFDVSWQVHNDSEHDLHHSEIRVCVGDVADCGLGGTDTYTSFTGTKAAETFTAPVQIDTAGMYTVVGWAHVGEDPHVSDSYTVDVQ